MTNNELDALVEEYYNAVSERKRGKIYLQIADKYIPYIMSKIGKESVEDTEDIIQIYHKRVIYSLNTWNRKASFSTYMWSVIRGTIEEWVKTNKNKMYRDGLYHIKIGDMDEFTYDGIREFLNSDTQY